MSDWLTDRYGREHTYLRISVTDRCNLRCTYCMPAEGLVWKPREEILTYEEIIRLARIFVEGGVTRIRLTGGEPTVRHEIETLMVALSALPGLRELLMTTNGVTLRDTARRYKASGLTGLTISLDTLKPERFREISRRDHLTDVLAGIEAALSAGFAPVKLNVVVMAGVNDDEVLNFVEFVKDRPLNVRFIEFMPFQKNGWEDTRMVPYRQLKARIQEHYELMPIRREPSAVAKDFALQGHPGTVSFVTSMTDSFCGTCSRVRLTADGAIKACLFHPREINIRDLLRAETSDDVLREKIREALLLKPEAHGDSRELVQSDNRSMIQIGG
ncbi:MAG TPA: GTP 3',8-cyclase MoaA [Coleofasciculaceae cyanobacterium]|jgi:cyclic pyranopterin phosphate synthase